MDVLRRLFSSEAARIATCIAVPALMVFGYYFIREQQTNSIAALATCFVKSEDATYTARCLKTFTRALLADYSTKELMAYVVSTSSPAAIRTQCHPVGHIIGAETYEKYKNLETALLQCPSSCRNSCTHGAIGAGVLDQLGESYDDADIAHADIGTLKTKAREYCEKSDSICHAIGHVAYITTRDILPAVSVCDVAADPWKREVCYEGVFMERAGALNALFPDDDVPPIPTRSGDYTYPCLDVPQKYRRACFVLISYFQKPVFSEQGIRNPDEQLQISSAACRALPAKDRAACFSGIGAGGLAIGLNALQGETLCGRFPAEKDRSACTLGVVPRFFFFDINGIYQYCESIPEGGRRHMCYDLAFQLLSPATTYDASAKDICLDFQPCVERYNAFLSERASLPDYRYGLFGKDEL